VRTTFDMTHPGGRPEVAHPDGTAWGRLLRRVRACLAPPSLTPLSRREVLHAVVGLSVSLGLLAALVAAMVLPSALRRLPLTDLVPLLGLPLLWAVCFTAYGVRTLVFGMPRTPRLDRIAQSPYLPRIFLEFGYAMFTLPVAACARVGITPNQLTLSSLGLTLVAAVGFGAGRFGFAGWALLLAFMLDAWDGILARLTNRVTPSGAFLDSTIDRYNDVVAFLGILYYYRNDPLPLFLGAAALVGSTVVSYARAKGAAVGLDPNVGYMQRHERAVWLGAGAVFSPILAAFVEPAVAHPRFHLMIGSLLIVALTANLTAVWRMRVVMRGIEAAARRGPPASDSPVVPPPGTCPPEPPPRAVARPSSRDLAA
jgi:CDP-diacylglycerol--glycerol-3-phosphate 3-phosphatidyltransferase